MTANAKYIHKSTLKWMMHAVVSDSSPFVNNISH